MNLEHLTQAIGRIHASAQMQAGQAVNRVLNWRNWLIGAYIVELEQGGENRAEYGEKVLETLPWRDGSWTERLYASLSFSHLLELVRVNDPLQRAFYELECIKSG